MDLEARTSLPVQYDTYDAISPIHFAGKLRGKVVLITGASAGLGREACLSFAAGGASVACIARRQHRLDDLVAEIKSKYDVPAVAIAADATDPSTSKSLVARVEEELGPIDILLNNAGITRGGPFAAEDDVTIWWPVMEVNLRGPVALTHAVLPSMIARKTGTIIAVSSILAIKTMPFVTAYGVSKTAISKFQENLAVEVGQHGIQCFSLHPGNVDTEVLTPETAFNSRWLEQDPQTAEQITQAFAELKKQTPRLMGDTCVALCVDERARLLSGKYIDCTRPLDIVLAEAEKEGGGRVGSEELYVLKMDSL